MNKWEIWVKYRNPWFWLVIPEYLHEWFFQVIHRKFGSKYLLIRVLGLQIEFYKNGKDVTKELCQKLKT